MQKKPKRFKHRIPEGVSEVVEDRALIGSPACVSPSTGVMRINPDVFYALPHEWQKWIILHESQHVLLGHTRENKMAEFEADEAASELFFAEGGSPQQSVKALTRVLPMKNEEQKLRAQAQLYRAAKYDWEVNKNPNAQKILQQMDAVMLNTDLDHYEEHYYDGNDDELSFLGMGKKARQHREEKKAAKQQKRELKNENKKSKINMRNVRSKTKEMLAEKGIDTGAGGVFGKVAELAGHLLGKKTGNEGTDDEGTDDEGTDSSTQKTGQSGTASTNSSGQTKGSGSGSGDNSEEDKKILGMDPTTFYIGLGVVIVIVIVLVVVIVSKKKGKTNG